MSLWTRLPEDVTALKKHWCETILRIDPADEAEYAAARQEDDPATFAEYIAAQHPGYMDGTMFKTLAEIIDGGRGSEDLATIDWTVLTLPSGTTNLLTSDRPLLWSEKFGSLDGFMAMPIGPQRLFIAARDPGYIVRLRQNTTVEELARHMNLLVVQAAKRFVYAHDEAQTRFIRNRFGTKAGPSVVEQVIAKKLGASKSNR